MEDTYLPAFQAGVVQGKASGIMCSYNAETYGTGLYGEGVVAQVSVALVVFSNLVFLFYALRFVIRA
jgi:hypothetical protein